MDGLGIFNRGWGYMVFFTVYLLFVQWMGMVLFFGQHLGLVLGAGWLLTACSHNWAAWEPRATSSLRPERSLDQRSPSMGGTWRGLRWIFANVHIST